MIRKILVILCTAGVLMSNAQFVHETEFDNYIAKFGEEKAARKDYTGSPYLDEEWRRIEVQIN